MILARQIYDEQLPFIAKVLSAAIVGLFIFLCSTDYSLHHTDMQISYRDVVKAYVVFFEWTSVYLLSVTV